MTTLPLLRGPVCAVCNRQEGDTNTRDHMPIADAVPLGQVTPCPDCGQPVCPDCLAERDCCDNLRLQKEEEETP